MCTFVFNVEIINIIILERSNYVTIYNRWEMNCQFLSPFVCSSRNHLLHFWVVQSLPRPASLSLWGKQAPQTVNAMLSFWASLFLTILIMSMTMTMAMIIIAQCVHWTVFFPFDRARWDISSNLKTVILLNIYLSQRARSKGTMRKLDFREPQTLNLWFSLKYSPVATTGQWNIPP